VLAEDFHDPALGSEFPAVVVLGKIFRQPDLLGDVVERIQSV